MELRGSSIPSHRSEIDNDDDGEGGCAPKLRPTPRPVMKVSRADSLHKKETIGKPLEASMSCVISCPFGSSLVPRM